jgi:hypothetical protein
MRREACVLGWLALVAGCATPSGGAAPAAEDPHAKHGAHAGHAGHAHHGNQNDGTYAYPGATRKRASGVAFYALGGSSVSLKPSNTTFRITRVLPLPDGFVGHLAYDAKGGRLWLVSYGPPANTRGPSTLYELDPATGRVLAQKALPFKGEFGAPLYRDGHLYLGIYHQRAIYQIAVDDRARLGEIVRTIQISSLNEMNLSAHKEKVFRYPFFAFSALVGLPDGKLLTHSEELGELVTLDAETGKALRQVGTQPSLEGLCAVPGPNGETLLMGNTNPHEYEMRAYMRKFLFRGEASAAPMASAPAVEETGVIWMLVDPESGEVLSSIWHAPSRAKSGDAALIKHEKVPDTPYGRYELFALGQEGLLTIEWIPSNVAWSVIDRGTPPQ